MGLQYRVIWIYRILIKLIHNRNVRTKFKAAVGKNVSVFDVACGYGQMADYMDDSVTYKGIDLNSKFIEHAQNHGKDVRLADIFSRKSYENSDVFVLVDLIHHLPEERLPELFRLVFKHTNKRVVILEPSFVDLKSKYGLLGSIIDWVFKKLDSDGLNKIEKWYSEDEYNKLFKSSFNADYKDSFEVSIDKVWPYYVVVYSKNDS